MLIKNRFDIKQLISQDSEIMAILRAIRELDLPDSWVCAGILRSKVWDTLHGFSKKTPIPDVDVIYFDLGNTNESIEKKWEKRLHTILPDIPWSVKNEARMHLIHNIPPYESSVDAIAKFPEIATAIGAKLDERNQLQLVTPHGVCDLLNLEIRPTPFFLETKERVAFYEKRRQSKNWPVMWPKLKSFSGQLVDKSE